uniref:Uncharacterized protein n=1 Tax=Clastoptera arizonana TaxID=38151 RepID=A0A1B6C7A2_9HEMI
MSGRPLGDFYKKELTKSIPLAKDMLYIHRLIVVGTLRGDKKEILLEMKDPKSRKISSVKFVCDNELVLALYKAQKSNMVYLISTIHEKGTIDETTGNANIVKLCN